MRPDVSEQLTGITRILEDVVVPDVEGAYPADVLDGVIATLDALAAGWLDVPAFLAWDARESAALLDAAGITVPDLPGDRCDYDVRALQAYHAEVRALLAAHVADVDGDALAAHLRARAERYPIKATQRMPGQRR